MVTARSSASANLRIATLLVGSLLGIAWPILACAQETAAEALVKAAYIDKLPQFVHWPASALAPGFFVLCVIGQSQSEQLLDRAVAGDSVQQHPIVVRRLDVFSSDTRCQMIFIDSEPVETVVQVLAAVRGKPVLTITNGEIDQGAVGIVNFIVMDGQVRFQVDRAEARRSGLDISSKLLGVAAGIVP